jgi:hypothetical protein
MGAWGVLAFDNDEANDWAYGLDEVSDLSLVDGAFGRVEASAGRYLEQSDAAEALGACEVVARLRGRSGYINAYTDKVDKWVAEHPISPSTELIARGSAVIDRELWEEAGDGEWRVAVADLRRRMTD